MRKQYFRLPAGEGEVARRIEDEIAFHLEERVASLIAQGVEPGEARRRAEAEFGDVDAARAELAEIDRVTVRRRRRGAWLDALRQDARVALRGAVREPAFSAAVMAMLALGIGANAAMFGITDRLLLSPPAHVVDPDAVVRVLFQRTDARTGEVANAAIVPYVDFTAIRDGVSAFTEVAAYSPPSFSVLGSGVEGTELRVVFATGSYFRTLGVRPAVGRFFDETEDTPPRGPRVLVLSHAFWRSRFGGDPNVVGRTVEIDHTSYEVIGVAPAGFTGIELLPVHAWAPVSAVAADNAGETWHIERNMHWLHLVARLGPGASAEAAQAQAGAAYAVSSREQFGDDPNAGAVLGSLIAARAPEVGMGTVQRSGRIALWLLGVSLLVLVIACANVTNLMLARGMRRSREIGVRLALGVGRARLTLQVLIEAIILAGAGALLGILLAHWGGRALRALLLPEVEWTGSPIDGRVLAFAVLVTCAAAVLAALAPALHAVRANAVALLGLGGRVTHRRSRLRAGLVALQATLSVVLLVGAGLFVRSLREVASVPLGFDPDRVASFTWYTRGLEWETGRMHAVYDAALERVRALPVVESAGLGMTVPMWSSMSGNITRVPGLDSVPRPPEGILYTPVSPDYFRTMGARVVRGRPFDERDVVGSTPVIIVTESLARFFWPGQDPIGRCFVDGRAEDAPCREVVGVVDDTRYQSVEADPTPMYFSPLAQRPGGAWRTLFVRFRGDPAAGIPVVRRAMLELEPGLPYVQATMLSTRVDPQLQPWRLGASLFTAFGALALLLAGLGIYSVIAYDVTQRRRELGIRIAFGARAQRLVRMVVSDAARVTFLGLVLGLAAAGWAAPRVEPLLFQVSPRDPLVLGSAATLLLIVGLLAAIVPALRAVHVQPMEALTED